MVRLFIFLWSSSGVESLGLDGPRSTLISQSRAAFPRSHWLQTTAVPIAVRHLLVVTSQAIGTQEVGRVIHSLLLHFYSLPFV